MSCSILQVSLPKHLLILLHIVPALFMIGPWISNLKGDMYVWSDDQYLIHYISRLHSSCSFLVLLLYIIQAIHI